MEISVDKNGQVYVGKDPVNDADLQSVLQSQTQQYPAEKVLLRGDREASYGDVAQTLAKVSRLLPDKRVILVTKPQDKDIRNTTR